MRKTVLYRLFKIGGIPKKLRTLLESEEIVVSDEGIGGWAIMKDFHAPGKRFLHRREGFSGFLAITRKRVVAYTYWKPVINVPMDDPGLKAITAELVDHECIDLSFESADFNPGWKGRVVLRFKTPRAPEFYSVITSLGCCPESRRR